MSTETYELLAITALVALAWIIYRIVRGAQSTPKMIQAKANKSYEISDGFSDDIRIGAETTEEAIAQFRYAAESWYSDAGVDGIEFREWKIDETPCESGNLFLYRLDDNGDRGNSVAMATFI